MCAIEVWTVDDPDSEELCATEMTECREFASREEALAWLWERLEEGFHVRMWRR